MSQNKNIIYRIVQEAKAYSTLEDIEKLVEQAGSLAVVPVQPLYIALVSSSTDQVAEFLPKLSPEQRQTMLDLDLWQKDEVDYEAFEFWIESYSKVKETETTQEFVESEDFSLYLRSRVNIYTFDVEDPQYPDHDFYFLTDDSQLLIEYGEDYKYPNELKYLIRNLYDEMGVENAYSHLFKIINDSHLIFEEKQYQAKKERLRDFGFVDYFDALEGLNEFLSEKALEKYVREHRSRTGEIQTHSQNQSLHSSALVAFDEEISEISEELALIEDAKRLTFLHFTFIRLVNSTVTLNDALKGGRVELTRISKQTKMILKLGLLYIRNINSDENVFDRFDFLDVYKIGKSLLGIEKRKIKKALQKTPFDQDDYEYFLGAWWNTFLENSFHDFPKVKTYGAALHAKDISDLATLAFWKEQSRLFVELLPFVNTFFEALHNLKKEGKLHDQFYLNYEVSNIDFESIMISSLINYCLDYGPEDNKMGITISELKIFFKDFFHQSGEEYLILPLENDKVRSKIEGFIDQYGMSAVKNITEYLYGILSEHLSGYEFDTLEDEEFRHIGGPILLNTLVKN